MGILILDRPLPFLCSLLSRGTDGRSLATALCFLIAILCGNISPASAQMQTYTYTGAPFNPIYCSAPSCPSGSITGSVTLAMAAGLTGGIGQEGVLNYSFVASGVGSVSNAFYNPNEYNSFYFINGQLYNWDVSVQSVANTSFPPYTTIRTTALGGLPPSGAESSLLTDGSGNRVAEGANNTFGGWSNAASLGACDSPTAPPGGVGCAHPISIGTGNMYDHFTDYETAGQNKLAFIRYYNSFSLPDTYATTLGQNWRSNYDRYLHFISANYINAERPDGQLVGFSFSSGSWSTDSDIDLKLSSAGSNWLLTDPNDTVETYFSSAGKGLLSSIKLRNGYTQTLTYSSSRASVITDSYSRTLGLTYSSVGMLATVSTPDTLVLTYGYTIFNSANTLTSVSYNTSPVTSQSYLYENTSYPYALTGITDENGNRFASWQYDSAGRATVSERALGADHTAVSYDNSTGNRTVTGPLGVQETYKFTYLQGVPKVTEIDRAASAPVAAATRYFTYDTNGYLATTTDWNSNQTAYTNNTHGDPTSIVFASGSGVTHTTTIAYDTTWVHLPKTITEPGLTTTLNYDSAGNVLTSVLTDTAGQSVPYFTSGQTRTWTYTWNGTGQLLTAQLPRTDVTAKTTYGYTGGTLTSITDALSHATNVLTYRSGGLPLTVTDQNSVLTTLAYNPRNWLTSSVLTLSSSAGTLTTTLAYDSAGNLTRYTLPDASYLSYSYDAAHRLTGIANALSESQVLTLNSAGNITQRLWKNSGGTTMRQQTATYDVLGRTLTDVGGMGQTTAYTYDNNGNPLTITDPLSQVTTLTFDSLNRTVSTKNPATNLIQYTYDAHDRVLSITDPRSHATSYTYDGYGDMIQEVSPDRGTSVLYFDSDGNVSQQTDANGYVTNMTYDALDRILTRTYPADSTLNAAFTWDQAGHGKGIGRLTSVTDQVGSLSRNYDDRGLLIFSSKTINNNTYATTFTYESAGRLSTLTYASSGWMVAYARDNAGQVTSVTDKPPASGAVNLVTSVTHMPFGPVSSMTWGNGVTDARTFDLDYRMTGVKDVGTGNIQYSSYGYNANNNLTSIIDNVTPANNQTLTFDSSDWLKFASGSYGTGITMTYDSSGNRKTYGSTTYTISSTSNRMTAIGASSLTFTSSGNITAIGANPTFTYNKANQMATAAVAGTTSTYGYDAFGQRLKAQVGTAQVRITSYGLGNELLTESNGGTKTDYAWLDGAPIAAIQPATSTISYIHTDRLGTPQKATNSSKSVVWNGAYDPNGSLTVTASITMNLRYPGMFIDGSGMFHNGFRNYIQKFQSGGGRYIEADPIGLYGGINPYAYVNNNTYRWTDRYGLFVDPVSVGIGVVLGAGGGYAVGGNKGAIVGGVAGGIAGVISPVLAERAGEGIAGFVAFEVAAGGIAGGATVVSNAWNGNPLFNDFGNSVLIGVGAPILSGEALLMGTGYLGSGLAAGQALGLNSGVIALTGTILDAKRGGLPKPNRGGLQNPSGCTVASPNH